MIKVADKAKVEVTKLMKDDGYNPSSDFVRVGVKSGGCSGLSYDLKFDKICSPIIPSPLERPLQSLPFS